MSQVNSNNAGNTQQNGLSQAQLKGLWFGGGGGGGAQQINKSSYALAQAVAPIFCHPHGVSSSTVQLAATTQAITVYHQNRASPA